jgi:hypothetical protein
VKCRCKEIKMKTILALLCALALTTPAAFAKDKRAKETPPQNATREVVVAQDSAEGVIKAQDFRITAGTRLRAQMENTVDTKTSRIGDRADAILIEPVQLDNVVLLPTGSRLRGRVAAVRAEDKKQKNSRYASVVV